LFHPAIKVISHLHYNISTDSLKKGLWYLFRNWIFDKSQKLDFSTVAVSKSTKKDYEDFLGWKNIKVIYNAIDIESIKSAIKGKIQKDVISSNDYNIIIPGRLHESKGHRYLVEAIYKLKSEFNLTPKVIIVGSGNIKDKIEKQINDLGIKEQFLFTGNLEQKELFRIMKLSDVVLIPSLFEAFGIVALEAMYLEKPTITTKIDGLQEITTDGIDTIQVEVKNIEEIKKALLLLIKDENLAQKLSKNTKQTAMKYDINKIVKQWVELFKSEKK
jgi:1,4-alpha-glucan branching enzyme